MKKGKFPQKKFAYIEEAGREYPPFLLIHGDADSVVPYHQSEKLYEKLQKDGYEARLIKISGGVHEGNFWTQELLGYIESYLKEKL